MSIGMSRAQGLPRCPSSSNYGFVTRDGHRAVQRASVQRSRGVVNERQIANALIHGRLVLTCRLGAWDLRAGLDVTANFIPWRCNGGFPAHVSKTGRPFDMLGAGCGHTDIGHRPKFALDIHEQSTTLWLWINWVQHLRLCPIPPGGR